MSRTLSAVALAAAMAQHTDEAFIILVTFTHVPTSETYRACLNTEDITSNGEVYTATYFQIALPEDSDRGPQGCQITVDNVDRQLVNLLRSITEPLQVTVQVVLASQPDTIEMEFIDLVLREASWDQSLITGTLMSEDPLNQAFPGHVYGPANFEGIF
jgi:hypothetical protein